MRTFTPHARGSTMLGWEIDEGTGVYPACAGIDLPLLFVRLQDVSLPRMRGDRPPLRWPMEYLTPFTPHARGSTSCGKKVDFSWRVYPACAGIDPIHLDEKQG